MTSRSEAVVGLRKNSSSGQPLLLSIDTTKYFFVLVAILNGPAKFIQSSGFTFSTVGSSPYWVRNLMGLNFLTDPEHSLHVLTHSITSLRICGHQKSEDILNVSSRPVVSNANSVETLCAGFLGPLGDGPCKYTCCFRGTEKKIFHAKAWEFAESLFLWAV